MSFISSKDNKEMLDQLMSFAEPMEPESTFTEMYKASTRLFINENLSYSAFLNDQNYEDRNQKVRDLVENNTIDKSQYQNYMGEFDYDRIAADTGEIKTNLELFIERNESLKIAREETQRIMEAGSGASKLAASILGPMSASFLEPAVLATIPYSVSGTTLKGLGTLASALKVAKTEAALAAGAETFIQPLVFAHKHTINSPYEVEDAFSAIGTVAIGAGILGGGVGGLSGYLKNVREKTTPIIKESQGGKIKDQSVPYDESIDVDASVAQAVNTPEDEALEILARVENELNSKKTARPNDILTAEYSKYKQGEYDTLIETKEATIKSLQKDINKEIKNNETWVRRIANEGGLNKARWAEEGFDIADMNALGKGTKPMFRKNGGMAPQDVSERFREQGIDMDDNMALDFIDDIVRDPSKVVDEMKDNYIKELKARLSDLEFSDNDVLEDLYHKAIEIDIEDDIQILRESQAELDKFNTSIYEDYIDEFPAPKTPNASVTAQQKSILDEIGIAKFYDDDIAAFNALAERQVLDDFDEFVDGDILMKQLDDEIEGLESVTRCAIG